MNKVKNFLKQLKEIKNKYKKLITKYKNKNRMSISYHNN